MVSFIKTFTFFCTK